MTEAKTVSGQLRVDGTVSVKCPYCEKPHKHQLDAGERKVLESAGAVTMGERLSDCFLGQYIIMLAR